MSTILVADDEPEVRDYLGVALNCDGHNVEFAENGDEVLERVQSGRSDVDLILLDLLMPYRDGFETMRELRRICPQVPVIAMSGAASPANIVTTMKGGAVDFLPKPINREDLARAIQKALPANQPVQLEAEPVVPMVGAWSKKLDLLLRRIGGSEVPVLLQGETGVGKEVLARKLHAKSARAGYPFLKLNCAALPSELVESELFGYERGAFTGAFRHTPGKFEMANQGTILLDEIGDMDFKLQAKLLQVVQDREFLRLGAKETTKVDVRVMAATHCNLEQAIAEGRFREDLYYRLNIIDIHIPPLRERRDEILPLADFFIHTHATLEQPALALPAALKNALLDYHWPGNIRELENIIRKYLVLRSADGIVEELARKTHRSAAPPSASRPLPVVAQPSPVLPEPPASSDVSILKNVDSAHKAAEAEAIIAALNSTLWNRKRAAALLKIDYKALLYKMKKLGIGDKSSA